MTTADAHFIRPLKNLEVQVTFQKTRFKAICSAFPECKGFGKSEDEAVDKLCKSISKFISNIAGTLVENVIREAVNPTDESNALPEDRPTPKTHKHTKQPQLSYPKDKMSIRIPEDQDIHNLIERLQGSVDYDIPAHSEIEGFYMGFPLSLN